MRRLFDWLYGRRDGAQSRLLAWPVALALIVVINVASAYFVQRLHVNNAPEVYYGKDSPAVQLRDALRREFPSDEVLTVVLQGRDLLGAEFLGRLDRLKSNLERHSLVDRVTTVASMERISGSDDGFAVERLLNPATRGARSSDDAMKRVQADRFAPGLLVARDGSAVAVAVRPKPLSESADRLALKVAVALAINEAGLRPYYAGDAGPVTIDVAQLDSVLGDSALFIPLTSAIGLLLLAWVVGRWRPVLIGAIAMSTVILPMVAAIAVAGQPYTMATAILPSLLAAYTLATLLHLYAAVQGAQRAHKSRTRQVGRALSHTLRPGAYNVMTTSAGLLSLVLVPLPPIQVFGVAGAFGTLMVFLTVFFLVPPLLVRWDRSPWPQRSSGMGRFGRIASAMTLFSMRHPKSMVALFALAFVAAFPFAQRVEVESNALDFFKPDHPVNVHTRLVESKFAGVTSLEISIQGQGRDSLQQVAALSALRDFQRWLEALPEVDRSVSMVDLVEEMHWAMNGEKPEFRALPGNDRLLRQYLLVYDGQDLFELVNRDFQHARIMLNLNVHGANEIGRTIDKIRTHVAAHPLPGIEVDIGGYGRLFADQVDLLVSGQINSFSGAFLQIFLIMAVLWRSLGASALCMVPNLAPLYFIFVLMGAASIHLDLATVMIAGVVLGITVDDTIHLYHGYRRRRQEGISPVLAIARSFESSGRAVLAISLLLVVQFGLLTQSEFIPTANFGLMTAVGLLAGQAFELLLLPALLVLKDARRRQATPEAAAQPSPAQAPDAAWAATVLLSRQAASGEARPGAPADSVPPDAVREPPAAILVCHGENCRAKGADALWAALQVDMAPDRPAAPPLVVQTSCLGPCRHAPVIQTFPSGRFVRASSSDQLIRKLKGLLAKQAPGGSA